MQYVFSQDPQVLLFCLRSCCLCTVCICVFTSLFYLIIHSCIKESNTKSYILYLLWVLVVPWSSHLRYIVYLLCSIHIYNTTFTPSLQWTLQNRIENDYFNPQRIKPKCGWLRPHARMLLRAIRINSYLRLSVILPPSILTLYLYSLCGSWSCRGSVWSLKSVSLPQ